MPDKTPKNQSAKVFVNYRREDSKDVTARLHESLAYALGADHVYMDFRAVTPGTPWTEEIRRGLDESQIVLCVMGRNWLSAQNPDTFQRRLDAQDDWVRLELELALEAGMPIIPVLVRDQHVVPKPEQLPDSIRRLSDMQGTPLTAERWLEDLQALLAALEKLGAKTIRDIAHQPMQPEPSMLGVLDYFFKRVGSAASDTHVGGDEQAPLVECQSMRDFWLLVEDHEMQDYSPEDFPIVRVPGQLSPYAPLLYGHPLHKRQLHLELRQGAPQLIREFGLEFGEILNGLMSYTAGQLVIRPRFQRTRYVYFGLYESIVRNSIPVMIARAYYETKIAPIFRRFNTLDVHVQGVLGQLPNYAKDALDDFGITKRLKTIVSDQTLQRVGSPNCALYVNGDEQSFVKIRPSPRKLPASARYLDGDIWVANSTNSLISRFVDIAWREDMVNAAHDIEREVREGKMGCGIVSSFDVRITQVDDTLPNHVLSGEQFAKHSQSN